MEKETNSDKTFSLTANGKLYLEISRIIKSELPENDKNESIRLGINRKVRKLLMGFDASFKK